MTAEEKAKELEQETDEAALPKDAGGPGLLRRFTRGSWLALLVGCLGIAATIITYLAMRKRPNLTYCVSEARAAIVRKGEVSELEVSYGGRKVAEDVTAVQIAVWNAGKQAIRPEHILSPIIIKTEPKVRILETKVRKMSRGVIAFGGRSRDPASGEVELIWRILERHDGAVVQVVFEGHKEAAMVLEGVIEGQASIQAQHLPKVWKSRALRCFDFSVIVICSCSMVLLLLLELRRFRRQRAALSDGDAVERLLASNLSLLITVAVALVVMLGILAWRIAEALSYTDPPFAF